MHRTTDVVNEYLFTWWSPGRRRVRDKTPASFPSILSHSLWIAPDRSKIITTKVAFQHSSSKCRIITHYKCKWRRWWTRRRTNLVLYGHDWVVLGGVDVQDMVVVLPTQVIGNVGEGGAGCLGHAVVNDDHIIFTVGWRWGGRVPFPQAVLCVPLLDLSHLVPGDSSFWGDDGKRDINGSVRKTRRPLVCGWL